MKDRNDHSKWIISILLLIIFVCSILLYLNLTQGSGEGDNPEIGVLVFKHKTIERKFDSDVIWDRMESGLPIRNKDTIRSGDFSDAVLILKDETKININENSMIYLDVTDNNINLNFAYGSLSLDQNKSGEKPSKSMKINSGNSVLDLKNSKITIEKKGKENLSFHLKEGNAKLKNGEVEKTISSNESVSVNENKVEISEEKIKLILPEDNGIITGKSKTIPVKFSWETNKQNSVNLEISLDSRFNSIVKSQNVKGNSSLLNLESGNYFWRTASRKGKKKKDLSWEYSPFRKLTIISTTPPTIYSPKMNHIFYYTSIVPMIDFSWSKIEIARYYKLEISKNANFSEIIKTLTTPSTVVSVDKLELGKYFARIEIEPISKEIEKVKSEVISFSIENKKQVEPPSIVMNRSGQQILKANLSKGILLQVKDSSEIEKYTFQVAKSKNFSKVIHEENTAANLYKLKEKLEQGEYFWRVSGTTKDGNKTAYSDIGKFTVQEQVEINLMNPPDNYNADIDIPISFQWKKLSFKGKFLLEIANSPDFTNKIHSVITDNYAQSYIFKSRGKYYWRVALLNEDNTALTKSKIFSLEIEEIKDVVPIFPGANSKVDMSFSNSLTFKWEKNPKIDKFEIVLYHYKNGKKEVVINQITKGNHYKLRDLTKLDEGKFVWTLQGFFMKDGKMQSGKTIEVPFKIFLSENKNVQEVETPEKMYVE